MKNVLKINKIYKKKINLIQENISGLITHTSSDIKKIMEKNTKSIKYWNE